jgi:cellobiose-specific phosphotransferase system component IIA
MKPRIAAGVLLVIASLAVPQAPAFAYGRLYVPPEAGGQAQEYIDEASRVFGEAQCAALDAASAALRAQYDEANEQLEAASSLLSEAVTLLNDALQSNLDIPIDLEKPDELLQSAKQEILAAQAELPRTYRAAIEIIAGQAEQQSIRFSNMRFSGSRADRQVVVAIWTSVARSATLYGGITAITTAQA